MAAEAGVLAAYTAWLCLSIPASDAMSPMSA